MALVLAHLSDLHFGAGPQLERTTQRLVRSLMRRAVDHVVISGDVTDRGRWEEYERFWACLAPLRQVTEVSVVPGNHDRLGQDVAGTIMENHRVLTSRHEGLFMIRMDSTAPHNCRYAFEGHGSIHDRDLMQLDRALDDARPGETVVVTMHHHPLPLPEEGSLERISAWFGLPFTAELSMGSELIACLRGRCDLLLHGHRHIPAERWLFGDADRPLRVVNAGQSSGLGLARLFDYGYDADLRAPSRWLSATEGDMPPRMAPPPAHRESLLVAPV
ncbi:MAG: metallophosphoesterase [Myxococcota bacterium]